MSETRDPPRWRDGAPDAPAGARELLAAARSSPPFTPAVHAETAAHLARQAAAPTGGGTLKSALRTGVLGLVGLGVAVALTVGVAQHARRTDRAASAPRARTGGLRETQADRTPDALSSSADAAVFARSEAPTVASPSGSVAYRDRRDGRTAPAIRRATEGRPGPSGESRQDELRVLERARQAVDADPRAALIHLRYHARVFPRSQHAEERAFIELRALARLDRRADLRARGAAFLARYPRGIYAEPARRLLATPR